MNKLNIASIDHDKIKISVNDTSSGVAVKFVGDIDMEDPSQILDPLFEQIHKGSVAQGYKLIEADFRELNFLNSSGIKAVAKWIMKLMEVPDNQKYQIKIVYNKEITWQTTSLPTLKFLVPGQVAVE